MSDRQDQPVMQSVYSSHVNKVGYDPQSKTLLVQWDTGKTSAYEGVPPDVADEAINAWSVGSFLNSAVKGRFRHSYV
jgi:hypothetical protein